MTISKRNWVILILTVGFFMRVAIVAVAPQIVEKELGTHIYDLAENFEKKGTYYIIQYFHFAGQKPYILERGNIYYSFYPILPAVFLSLLKCRDHLLLNGLYASLLLTFVLFINYLTIKRTSHAKTALVTLVAMTFYPRIILAGTHISTELVGMLFFSLLVHYSYYLLNNHRLYNCLMIGACSGLCALARAPYGILFGCLFIYMWFTQNKKSAILRLAIITLVFFVTLFPWMHRNYKIHNIWKAFPMQLGMNLWLAHNNQWDEPYHWGAPNDPENFYHLSEVEEDQEFQKRAFQYIQDHPGKSLLSYLKQCYYFWNPFPRRDYVTGYRWSLAAIPALILMVFALGGIIMCRNKVRYYGFYILILFSAMILHAPFIVVGRYRMLVLFILFMFASEFCVDCFSVIIKRITPSERAPRVPENSS